MSFYDGYRWGYVFLDGHPILTKQDKEYLMAESIDMFIEKEDERKIKTDSFEGILHRTGKTRLLGAFGGKEYKAELETNKGDISIRFLVTEYHDPRLN